MSEFNELLGGFAEEFKKQDKNFKEESKVMLEKTSSKNLKKSPMGERNNISNLYIVLKARVGSVSQKLNDMSMGKSSSKYADRF